MELYDVSEWANWNIPPLQFYIGGRLLPQKGKLELCGAPGVMKSWLAQSMGFCLATGQPWLGFPTVQTRTLICHFEMSREVAHERITEMMPVYHLEPMSLYIAPLGTMFLDEQESFNRFKEAIEPIAPGVIILDYWRCCYGGDENDSRDVVRFTRNMDILIRELNTSVVLLHHTNKNPLYTGGMDKSSGHHALPGWMDTVLYLVEQPLGLQLQFSKTRHARGNRPHSLNIVFNNYQWSIRGQGGTDAQTLVQ